MLWIILAIVVLLILFIISVYNNLVTLRQRVKNAFGQMDVQLQRRFDLIPNLVETVKGYMTHESDTLTKIAELRTAWAGAKTVDEKAKLDNELSSSLKTIMAVAESYPDLKANQNFLELQAQLEGTENRINVARKNFNDAAQAYNTNIRRFPKNIFAGMFGFDKKAYFEAEEGSEKAPKVEF